MNSVAAHISPSPEDRQHPRTHLFVAATLYADSGSTPVHIRNMSQSGAMIEGAVLPDVGERIALKRGQLHAAGSIAWRVERRAGVKLETAIYVSDWMARLGSAGQERVDTLVALARSDAPKGSATPAAGGGTVSIEAELALLRTELTELENVLIGDAIVVATHPEIQVIDISVQRIDRIARLLRTRG